MKRHLQELGVRKWSGNDLLELQSEGLSVLDGFFAQYGNCIISGCEVVENSICEGLVSIDGMVLPFDGAIDIHTFPVFLKKSETHSQREYADGVVRDIAVQYYAEMVFVKPADSHIVIALGDNVRFFDKVNSGLLEEMSNSIETLRVKDIVIMNILQQLDIPTLTSEPTFETLTYNKEDKTYNFWIGQQCRVYNSEAQKYTFYQLYNIVNGVADWQTLGKGDDTGMYEAPTLDDIPSEETLTYTKNNKQIAFLIGQQCRVYDETNDKYVFYQLYNINAQSKANWQIVGTDGSTFEEAITIILESNQVIGDAALVGTIITVGWPGQEQYLQLIWNGTPLSALIPMSVQYEVSVETIHGYASPESQIYLAIGGNKRQINLVYSCEKIVATITANDGTTTNDRTVIVKHAITDVILDSGTGSTVYLKVPIGTPCKIHVDDWAGFTTPSEQSFTADNSQRNVLFEYKRIVDASIVFDKSISDPENITGEVNKGVIATILSKFRRCLCKKTAEGEVTISYLHNNNSTIYEDGTAAILTGEEGDVMVNFPEFYYKREDIDANRFRYRFSECNVDGSFKHVPRSLVGAYKAYLTGSKLYSRSGVMPTASIGLKAFSTAAQARGVGYQLINFQQHCVIAFMLYAKYGTRDLRAVLGTGSAIDNFPSLTGTTDSVGNNDTTRIAGTHQYVNGLCLEGVFGGSCEWVQGVSYNNAMWTITDYDGAIRHVNSCAEDGWIKNIAAENGEYFDMIPTDAGGSSSTYYSNVYSISGTPQCLMRAGRDWYHDNGVATTFIVVDSNGTGNCSRLAFRGKIVKAASVSSFKALPIQ